ncbi:Hsp70 family protein [Lentzea sp. BCCO 10_0856]|uniref:Hsp70 family protein n=1 Tax=Lentzea miocenica TaxID=3095431 RepID=A0ABU4TGR4_9PSEU|nr:Hsp70 family protein [Lentzea sp. BCCO 10_0856]MDX8037384.1 Hsp70 family protein [Lentzea sp. BCCO 10_0856]
MPFHKVIGIDLGTTYSAVSIWDGKDTVVIESALGTKTVPSVVGLDPEGQVIVGAPAQNNLASDPGNTVIEVKRDMGVYLKEPTGPDEPGVPKRVRFRGREYLPQEISAFILMELKRQAENFIGEPIHDAVITVPAYFREPQRGATEDAARMARLNVRRLVNEPTAAAVCFGADKIEDEDTHTYAVYDLGGGTFDVSIIQVSPGNISVVGTGGDPRLGGGDFDDRVTGYVLNQIKEQHGTDLSGDHAIWQRVKREAEMRKRELSVAGAATLNLPFLTPQLSVNVPLTRTVFESLIKDLLDRSLACLDEAIESARESNGIERDEIEQVLLVGGSTRIACIRPMLAEHLGLELKDVRSDISPDEVVARGAGMVARDYPAADGYEGEDLEMAAVEHENGLDLGGSAAEGGIVVLQDVTSHTLGILVNKSDFAAILPKDSRIPGSETQDNFVNGGKGKQLIVRIFQGENAVAYENDLIGKLPIDLPEAREAGFYRFAVTFSIDESGLLGVSVKCLNDDQIWRTELQCDVRATREQIESSAAHLKEVMAGQRTGLPEPPGGAADVRDGLPKPPGAAPSEVDDTDHADTLPPPPENTPAEFKSVARRSYKLVSQLPESRRAELASAYLMFVIAVRNGSSEVEDLGDKLNDVFYEHK